MGGEKVNEERGPIAGSVRRVDARGEGGVLPSSDKGLPEMTLVYIYLPLEQKHIVGCEYVKDKSRSGKQSVRNQKRGQQGVWSDKKETAKCFSLLPLFPTESIDLVLSLAFH